MYSCECTHRHTTTHMHTHITHTHSAYPVIQEVHTHPCWRIYNTPTSPLPSLLAEVLHCFLCLLQFLSTQDHLLRGEVPFAGVLQLGHWKARQAGLEVHCRDAAMLQEWVVQGTAAAARFKEGLQQEAAIIYL